jgi:hypothetical protein
MRAAAIPDRRGPRGMKALIGFVLGLGLVALLLQTAAVGGAWVLGRQGKYEDQIHWLMQFRPILVWDGGVHGEIASRYRGWVAEELKADRLDRAVAVLRRARAWLHDERRAPDREMTVLGIETYTRSADRLERRGQLAKAADWNDTLFVFAVRADDATHRFAAAAAFVEGLDLRVRAGQPCAAVARIDWAKRGLGGEIPGVDAEREEGLRRECERTRRRGRN